MYYEIYDLVRELAIMSPKELDQVAKKCEVSADKLGKEAISPEEIITYRTLERMAKLLREMPVVVRG